jgi:uncharacterized protein YdhG (YjbR/CyaY superfamily)
VHTRYSFRRELLVVERPWTSDGNPCSIARMHKAESSKPGPRAKSKGVKVKGGKSRGAAENFDEYLAAVPAAARGNLKKMRAAIRTAVPREATEIISYGIPAFRNKVVLVWFAAFSDHYSLFPTAAVIEEFKTELKDYSTSKGTVHFPAGKPVPVVLVRKLVKARVARAESKKKR